MWKYKKTVACCPVSGHGRQATRASSCSPARFADSRAPDLPCSYPVRVFSADMAEFIDLAWEKNTLKHDWKIVVAGRLFTSTTLGDTVLLFKLDYTI
ncbi:MAG: hypothetical protein V4554_14145 [Pseudomonadota bacterium]